MTTPTPIETFEDILAALERNPQFRAAMRQHILDQEFLQLPAIVRELQQAVTQLTQLVHDYIAATDARLGQIETDVTEIKGQQTTMSGQITTMSGQIANLAGSDYESKAIEQSRRMVRGHLEMVKATVIHASRWGRADVRGEPAGASHRGGTDHASSGGPARRGRQHPSGARTRTATSSTRWWRSP